MAFLKKIKGFIASVGERALGNRKKEMFDLAKIHGEGVKRAIINMVKNHDVSNDLMSHAQSEYLNGRTGTLFGFLGFPTGTDPVQELVDFLEEFLVIEPKIKIGLTGITVDIKLPPITPRDLVKAGLALPWQKSLAWPYAIEGNISNLPFFLSINKGRSMEGLQRKKAKVGMTAEFTGTPYLSDIIKNSKRLLRVKKFRAQGISV